MLICSYQFCKDKIFLNLNICNFSNPTAYCRSVETALLRLISGVFFKFHHVVGVEESIVNAPLV
jgi:hypothetical protein